MANPDKKGFTLYKDLAGPLSRLTLEQKGMILDAVFAYQNGQEVKITDPLADMAFSFFEIAFQRDENRAAERSQKSRDAANSRWSESDDSQNASDANSCDRMQTHASASGSCESMQPHKNDAGICLNNKDNIKDKIKDNIFTSPKGDVVGKDADPAPDTTKGTDPSDRDFCPHQRIIELYHECLPTLPRVKVWDDYRQGLLRQRWRERMEAKKYHDTSSGLEYWGKLFRHINTNCNFLMGRIAGRGERPFLADLEWIVRPRNFSKIIEGRYDNKAEVA